MEPVTLFSVIDFPALVTAIVSSLGSSVGLVLGAVAAFLVIRRGLGWTRKIDTWGKVTDKQFESWARDYLAKSDGSAGDIYRRRRYVNRMHRIHRGGGGRR